MNMEGDVIYIDGLGPIGQYYNYYDTFWAKGVAYFIRDLYFQELNSLLSEGKTNKQVKQLVKKINQLNQRIREFEENKEFFLEQERQHHNGLNRG